MNSLQTKLFRAFSLVILVFGIAGIGLFALNRYVANQYKSVSDNMIAEYHLTDAAARLIAAYNFRFLSTGTDEETTNKQITNIKSEITSLTSYLNGAVVDPQSKTDFIGLKNSIDAVVAEINIGLELLHAHDVNNVSTHYDAANKKYTFVTQDSSTLLFDELRHSAAAQVRADRTYKTTSTLVIIALGVMIIGTIVNAYNFARRLIIPLKKLTDVAGSIAGGNLDATIDQRLLLHHDEVGSLAQSFNLMLTKLKSFIEELNQEKITIEHKVEERTAELRNEQARLAASVNSLSLGFIMTDDKDKIIMMNSRAREVLSYKVNDKGVSVVDPEYAEHDWTVADIDDRLKDHFKFKEALDDKLSATHSIERKEVEYSGRILRLFMARISGKGVTNEDEELGSVILAEDITEEKVLQRSRDEFFSIASHELRTPLTTIRGNSAMIEQFYGKDIKDDDFHHMLDDIHESSVRLIEIVNDFLDVSSLEQGKILFKPEAFDIDAVIENVIYETATLANQKHNKVTTNNTLGKTPGIYADKNRVKQIVYNLVGNAMKFTENGTIAVECEVQGKLLKVSVTDTGRGISPEGQKLLFHKFQQAGDSLFTRDTTKGTGLGLYISKMLSEKMGGGMTLERSEIGKGTTFSFSLPLATKEQQKPATPAPEADTPAPPVEPKK